MTVDKPEEGEKEKENKFGLAEIIGTVVGVMAVIVGVIGVWVQVQNRRAKNSAGGSAVDSERFNA